LNAVQDKLDDAKLGEPLFSARVQQMAIKARGENLGAVQQPDMKLGSHSIISKRGEKKKRRKQVRFGGSV
jgi:hypothetical protein